jgi:hypothetical protein
MRLDQVACGREFDVADHEDRRVIGMIERVVEIAQPLRRDPLNVGAPPDRRMVIGMLAKRRRDERLIQHARGAIIVTLELVAHDGHFRTPLDVGDQRASHAIRFELDCERQILDRHGFEIHRAIEPGGRVFARADFVHDVRERATVPAIVSGRTLEQHMLEQMRGTGITDRFVPRADAVDHEQRCDGCGSVRNDHGPQPIGENELMRLGGHGRRQHHTTFPSEAPEARSQAARSGPQSGRAVTAALAARLEAIRQSAVSTRSVKAPVDRDAAPLRTRSRVRAPLATTLATAPSMRSALASSAKL